MELESVLSVLVLNSFHECSGLICWYFMYKTEKCDLDQVQTPRPLVDLWGTSYLGISQQHLQLEV